MTAPSRLSFDIREIPFSRRGAWFDVSPVVGLHTMREHLHLVSHQTGMHPIIRFEPDAKAPTLEASPACLRWRTPEGAVEAVFEDDSTLRMRGRGLAMTIADATSELTPFTGSYLFRDPVDGAAVLTSYETGRRYRVTVVAGEIAVTGAELLGAGARSILASGAEWEIAIEEYETARAPYSARRSFDDLVAEVEAEFDEYVERVAPWRSERSPAAAAACYVLWSATVSPKGFLERESVVMSKHWMDKVWSWDHCFNALALAPGLPREAVEQFRVVFDFQDPTGALPDSVTHSEVLYNFVKPPIHGWALRKLRASLGAPLAPSELVEIYDALAAWTRFWLDRRRVPGHPLAHYQHGNDSGWDNATTFDRDRVIEAPDLAAFLVVQLGVLADLAVEVARDQDAAGWRAEARSIRAALLELWDEESFVARAPGSGRMSTTTSLLNTLPIVASPELPDEINGLLAARIERHLTDFGPATELVDSPEYEADGYWRGPVWAPSTVLVEDGLRQAGETALADRISERFRRLCERSGFAENFDALTGAGLRDRAYTWTASCYLLLAREAEERAAAG
ncbi:glycogen debranching protein [Cnuibacter physcomitrellae]|uniref:amylo-alpha-1,6-glucosidase n=1 Tax=Cnuibacter physcomitrellae TaxID=1619308 RepID=UPI0021760CDB|nr:glycogen debranching protein [Cnuibacter physcomitrellae]MCS5499359.1 glycogen debranching protein [Cnuibacter physcomitrellae]